MNRRRFISSMARVSTGTLLLSTFLQACKKATLFDKGSYNGKVIIVGAGVSGMYAAYLLKRAGAVVKVLEASGRYGGRIRPLKNFADFTIELGAEEVHGERSLWYDLVKASGAEFISDGLNDLYYFNGSLKTQEEAEMNTFFNQMNDLIASLHNYNGNDKTALEWANDNGLSNNIMHIYNAFMGNEYGTSVDRISVLGMSLADNKWTSGNGNYMLKSNDLLSILESRFAEIIPDIQLNTIVSGIDYTGPKIIVSDTTGQVYEADKIILTVPLTVLRSGDITFSPPLDESKTQACQKIGMDRGMKVIIQFDQRIWPENTGSIYSNGLVPLFWPTGAGGRGTDNVLTAFVCGPNADTLVSLGDDLINQILTELDNTLGDASAHYVNHFIQDWGSEPFIRGAYSYPKPGEGNAREVLAASVQNKLFFAGEATHTGGHYATVHGAMETALRAVNEIIFA